LAASALALVGVFIVLRRAVFAAATVGQAAGLGVVLAFYSAIHLGVEVPPLAGALALAGISTVVLACCQGTRLSGEAVLGLVFLVASAAAIALGDRITQEAHEVSAILFGSAVVVAPNDVGLLAGLLARPQRLTPRRRSILCLDSGRLSDIRKSFSFHDDVVHVPAVRPAVTRRLGRFRPIRLGSGRIIAAKIPKSSRLTR